VWEPSFFEGGVIDGLVVSAETGSPLADTRIFFEPGGHGVLQDSVTYEAGGVHVLASLAEAPVDLITLVCTVATPRTPWLRKP
jgi:hypothetical protein